MPACRNGTPLGLLIAILTQWLNQLISDFDTLSAGFQVVWFRGS